LADDRDQIGKIDAPPFAEVAEALALGVAYQILVPADGSGGRLTRISANCEALTGVPVEAALANGRAIYDLIVAEQRAAFDAAEADAVAGSGRFEIEVQMRGPGDQVRWRRVSSARRELAGGDVVWDGLICDIDEAKRIADELEERISMAGKRPS